jgi:hypothetical protein
VVLILVLCAVSDPTAELHYTFSNLSPLFVLLTYLGRRCDTKELDEHLSAKNQLDLDAPSEFVDGLLKRIPREIQALGRFWAAQSVLMSSIDELGELVLRLCGGPAVAKSTLWFSAWFQP